jgi:DNA-binding MarR family transcriptional regulator
MYKIKELRSLLNLTPGRITHILTTLEAKKLISRTSDSKDNRVILVKLLPKANPLIKNLHQNYRELHNQILKNVNEKELDKILSSLQILVKVFKEWVNQK